MTRGDKIASFLVLPGLGALVLALGPLLAAWLADFPIPFGGVLEWIGDFDGGLAWAVRIGGGALLGAILAAFVVLDEGGLEVADDHVVVTHGEDRRRLDRADIVGIHTDGKRVVIDGTGGRVLFDQSLEAERAAVAEAFTSRGYPFEMESPSAE